MVLWNLREGNGPFREEDIPQHVPPSTLSPPGPLLLQRTLLRSLLHFLAKRKPSPNPSSLDFPYSILVWIQTYSFASLTWISILEADVYF